MDRSLNVFQEIHLLTDVDIFCYQNQILSIVQTGNDPNPISTAPGLLEELIQRADKQEIPVVSQDEFEVLFACVKTGETYYLLGPMSLSSMSRMELHRYYSKYIGSVEVEKNPPVFSFSKALALVGMLAKVMLRVEYSMEDLIRGNRMADLLERNIEQERILFQMKEDEKDVYHHTYSEECELLACVREGRAEDALDHAMRVDLSLGRMSKTEMTHWKKAVVVAIALCVRAAIEGGIPPKEAYQLSDFYLQKSDECRHVTELIAFRNRAIRDLAERVLQKKTHKKSSNYVEICKDYIEKHYKEKIYLDDIAEALGVSSTYLSRLFSKETGMRLQDYITGYRIDWATNMLLYSDESIAYIAEYVNFPSQSYFGKVFKKYKGMTPKEYREKYRMGEFKS